MKLAGRLRSASGLLAEPPAFNSFFAPRQSAAFSHFTTRRADLSRRSFAYAGALAKADALFIILPHFFPGIFFSSKNAWITEKRK